MNNEQHVCNERTTNQWIAFKYFTAQSSVLSILGSSLIIFMVCRRAQDRPLKFQNRLLLPMCVFDIIGSLAWAFTTMPIPRGSSCTYGAIGNEVTCVTQGFMATLGLCVPMYNAMLCIYYLLVVKYNVSDEKMAKYEPLMHIVSICPALTSAILAATNDLFNNYSQMCWIRERNFYEDILDNASDHKDSNSPVIFGLYMVTIIFAPLTLLTIVYCMISIYRSVKEQELKMSQYQFQRPTNDDNNVLSGNTTRSQSSRLSSTVIDTKKQAFLYIGSFILTYLITSIIIILESVFKIRSWPFTIMMLHGITSPLQGFWNFLAYIRPRFNIISTQHNEKSIFSRLYITVFHKPELSSRQPRGSMRRRQRRRLGGGRPLRSNVTPPNNVATSQKLNYNNSVVVASNNPDNVVAPTKPESLQFPYELQQQPLFVPSENPQKDDYDAYDDKDSLLEQNDDDYFKAPNDYREAVTLSLLVAEDILPRSLHRNSKKKERRVSMIDIFPSETDSGNRSSQCHFPSFLEGGDRKEPFDTNQRRRHSCPLINDITQPQLQEG